MRGRALRLYTATLKGWVHPSDAFIVLHANDQNAFWLDREAHQTDQFSVIGASTHFIEGTDLSALRNHLEVLAEIDESQVEVPFSWRPGLVGYLGFEGEFGFLEVDRAMVFDHQAKHMYFIGYFESQHEFTQWHHAGLLRLGLTGGQVAQYIHERSHQVHPGVAQLAHDSSAYLQLITKAQEFISAGDVYQLCLTNQITIKHEIDPLIAFLQLRKLNPSPYSTYFKVGELALVSASPEQFLKVEDRRISTKPIKGTRPRSDDPVRDTEIATELANNSKERAENLMIVDLMRNDFARVAKADSIAVPKLFDIESYATVHQLVSTVQAELRDECDAISAIEAAFPGGSMTGAPKGRAIEIIGELEAQPRHIYSGILGHLGFDGSAELAMIIRTMVFTGPIGDQEVSIGVGGGITIDSDPAAELEETKLKAAALLKVLGVGSPWA